MRFAPDGQLRECHEEIERWLPVAVGYSVYDSLLTDKSDLTDFMDLASIDECWRHARMALLGYGVDVRKCLVRSLVVSRKTFTRRMISCQ